MSGRRIDLSATQVIASLLAAVTGAVAASTLGVAGTVIGTAVMSVASTAIAAVYKHYIGRSRERLRAAAESARIPPLVGDGPSAAIRRLHRATQTAQQTAPQTAQHTGQKAPVVPDGRHVAGADGDKTEVLPTVGFNPHRWHDADRADGVTRHLGDPADGATEADGAAAVDATEAEGASEAEGATEAGSASEADGASEADEADGADAATEADSASEADGESTEAAPGGAPPADPGLADREAGEPDADDAAAGTATHQDAGRSRWRRPLVLAGATLGVFLLAIGAVTAFEAAAGKPLDAIVGGKHNSGTTIGSLIGGQSAHTVTHRTSPTPTPTPAPTSSTSASPTPTPTPTSSPTPAPTPSPTSNSTPTPTSGPTQVPSSHASARSDATASPAW